jgi:hypothetical protein
MEILMDSIAYMNTRRRSRLFRTSSPLRSGQYPVRRKMSDKLAACRTASRIFIVSVLRLQSQRLLRQWAGLTLLTILLSSMNFGSGSRAQAQEANEYQVKAAFLYNFAKFVEWPSEAFSGGGAPLVVGLIGDDPFGSGIDRMINGKSVNGHPLTIQRLKWGQNLRACHILFISSSERRRLAQILESVKGSSVLTVGEMDQFSQQGGIINFVMEANKVRFEINVYSAEQGRLKISSKLLTLAKSVRGGQRGGGD